MVAAGGMRLLCIHFDDMVTIDQGRSLGGGHARHELREHSFFARDGWDIRRVEPGVFTVWTEGMDEPMTLEGYGVSYRRMPEAAAEAEPEPVASGNWREQSKRKGKR
jgi:hypothetical protein